MKKLALISLALIALTGCATQQPAPANYGTRAYGAADPADGWQVVSVTPVPLGTGARVGDAGVITSSPVVVQQAPVYVPQPVYVPPPVYVREPYYWPPISIGLGFNFGRSWGHHHHHRPRHWRHR